MAKKKNQPDLAAVRSALGVGQDVTDEDLRLLLSTEHGKEILKHIESQPKGGGLGGFISGGLHGLEHPYQPGGPVSEFGAWLTDSLHKSKPAAPKASKTDPAKPLPSPQAAAQSTPESPYQQLAQSLASEYLNQVQQLMPLTSGSAIPGLTAQVTGQAAAAVPGMGGGWLQQQAAAEQKSAQAAGLPQAMNAVGEAQAQGAIPYANAIANTGTANTAYLEAAPWQQILAELASETAYKAASSQGAAAFGATPQNTPAFLQQIFKNLGLAGTAQGPAGGLQAPGTAAKSGSKSTSTALSSGSSQTG